MTKCLKNADGSKMTENRQKWLKNAKNVSKMLKIAQKCIFFRFSTRRFAVALQLLELSLGKWTNVAALYLRLPNLFLSIYF